MRQLLAVALAACLLLGACQGRGDGSPETDGIPKEVLPGDNLPAGENQDNLPAEENLPGEDNRPPEDDTDWEALQEERRAERAELRSLRKEADGVTLLVPEEGRPGWTIVQVDSGEEAAVFGGYLDSLQEVDLGPYLTADFVVEVLLQQDGVYREYHITTVRGGEIPAGRVVAMEMDEDWETLEELPEPPEEDAGEEDLPQPLEEEGGAARTTVDAAVWQEIARLAELPFPVEDVL